MLNTDINFETLVVTRFGIGISNLEWLTHRLKLWQMTSLASLSKQHAKNFHWLILVDVCHPDSIRTQMESLIAPYKNFYIHVVDTSQNKQIFWGGFPWQSIEAHKFLIKKGFVKSADDMVLIANIDDDDAWHNQMIERAHLSATQWLKKMSDITSNHGGAIFSWPKGWNWYPFDDFVYEEYWESHSMSNFMLAPVYQCLSLTSLNHAFWPKMAKSLNLDFIENHDFRGWLYTRHTDNLTRIIRDDIASNIDNLKAQHSAEQKVQLLGDQFGIDDSLLSLYREKWQKNWHEQTRYAKDSYVNKMHEIASRRHFIAIYNNIHHALTCEREATVENINFNYKKYHELIGKNARALCSEIKIIHKLGESIAQTEQIDKQKYVVRSQVAINAIVKPLPHLIWIPVGFVDELSNDLKDLQLLLSDLQQQTRKDFILIFIIANSLPEQDIEKLKQQSSAISERCVMIDENGDQKIGAITSMHSIGWKAMERLFALGILINPSAFILQTMLLPSERISVDFHAKICQLFEGQLFENSNFKEHANLYCQLPITSHAVSNGICIRYAKTEHAACSLLSRLAAGVHALTWSRSGWVAYANCLGIAVEQSPYDDMVVSQSGGSDIVFSLEQSKLYQRASWIKFAKCCLADELKITQNYEKANQLLENARSIQNS